VTSVYRPKMHFCFALSLALVASRLVYAQTFENLSRGYPGAAQWRPAADSLNPREIQSSRFVAQARADSAQRSSKPSAVKVIGGALIGGGVGLAIGYALAPRSHCSDCGVPSSEVQRSDFLGAGIGVVVGGALGWYFSLH
jgi:hypothetical protein